MRSPWVAAAVVVVGVICLVGSGADSEKKGVVEGNGTREMELYNYYKEIVEGGVGEGEECSENEGNMGALDLERFAGLTPIEMYQVFATKILLDAEKFRPGTLEIQYNEYIADLKGFKGKADKCRMKDRLDCHKTDLKCFKCEKPQGYKDCDVLRKIEKEDMAEATTSPPKVGGGSGDGKSGAGGKVSSVGGALLAALVAAFFSLSV